MIARYSLPEMAALFTDEARLERWLEVEILAVEGWSALGVVPASDAEAVRARAPKASSELVSAVADREKVTDHDVAAFVDVVQEAIGMPAGSWVHYGLTSSDVVDTALCATLRDAADLLLGASDSLVSVLKRRAVELIDAAMVGRTHGMHAEPFSFGAKLALWCLQADRDRQRLRAARERIAVGKLSGVVGTYSNIDPRVEEYVCSALGLRAEPATQVIARDRHAELFWACAASGATVEAIATEVRLLARTEVGEVSEAFGAGQKGSSAMPHKRNPVVSERLCGLARLLRGYLGAGLEDIALWHERDISHSSVERVALPDACLLTHYVLHRCASLVDGLVVNREQMRWNLEEGSLGLVFSQAVLLALVSGGMERDAAYRVVQRDARRAVDEERPLRAVLEEDEEVKLDATALERAFDLRRSLLHVQRFLDAIEDIEEVDSR